MGIIDRLGKKVSEALDGPIDRRQVDPMIESRRDSALRACPSCGFHDSGRFCSNCGASLEPPPTIMEAAQNIPAIASPGANTGSISVEFPNSSSQNFELALEEARSNASYRLSGQGKSARHTVDYRPEELNAFFRLYDLIASWRNVTLIIGGQSFSIGVVRQALSCFRDRGKAFRPELYCFGYREEWALNRFGCRHLKIGETYDSHRWFTIGRLDRSGVFHMEKKEIEHIALVAAEELKLCPAFDWDSIKRRIDVLPDRIDPRRDKGWNYRTDFDGEREIAVGVEPKPTGIPIEYDYRDGKFRKRVTLETQR